MIHTAKNVETFRLDADGAKWLGYCWIQNDSRISSLKLLDQGGQSDSEPPKPAVDSASGANRTFAHTASSSRCPIVLGLSAGTSVLFCYTSGIKERPVTFVASISKPAESTEFRENPRHLHGRFDSETVWSDLTADGVCEHRDRKAAEKDKLHAQFICKLICFTFLVMCSWRTGSFWVFRPKALAQTVQAASKLLHS